MRLRHSIGLMVTLSALTLPSQGCRPRGAAPTSAVRADQGAGAEGSLMAEIHRTGMDTNQVSTITPGQYYRQAFSGPDAAIKKAFLQNFLTVLLAGQSPAIIKNVVETSFAVSLPPPPAPSADGSAERLYIRNAIGKVFEAVEANPDLLNMFPNIPLEQSGALQASLFGDPNSVPLAPVPFPAAPGTNTAADLKSEGCTFQDWPAQPVYGNLFKGRKVIREGAWPCFHENSKVLAQQINRLANNVPGNPTPYSFTLTLPGAGSGSAIGSYEDLLKAFHAAGYTVEFFTSRVLVEFEAFFVQQGNERQSLRAVTWITVPGPNGRRIFYPAEHGEIGLLVHKDGKRVAQVRWYGGLPDDTLPGLFAFWRPTPELASPWNGILHENIEVYAPGSDIAKATQWFTAATRAMKGFVDFQRKYKPKFNSYGLFVCTDSLVVAMSSLGNLRGSSERMSQAFPIVRPIAAPGENAATRPIDGLLEASMGMAPGSLSKVYLTDSEAYGTARAADPAGVVPAQFRERLSQAFPQANAERLKAFPEAQGILQATVW